MTVRSPDPSSSLLHPLLEQDTALALKPAPTKGGGCGPLGRPRKPPRDVTSTFFPFLYFPILTFCSEHTFSLQSENKPLTRNVGAAMDLLAVG
jgi:hypothetical protein